MTVHNQSLKGITYVFTWHSLPGACPDCQRLNGKTWADQDLFAPMLVDSVFGPIWNLDLDHSMMHGESGTCRCQITARVLIDYEQIEAFKEAKKLLESWEV